MTRRGTRVAAATIALGFSLAGPQALGSALADTGEADGATEPTSVSAGPGPQAGGSSKAAAARPGRENPAGVVRSAGDAVAPRAASAVVAGASAEERVSVPAARTSPSRESVRTGGVRTGTRPLPQSPSAALAAVDLPAPAAVPSGATADPGQDAAQQLSLAPVAARVAASLAGGTIPQQAVAGVGSTVAGFVDPFSQLLSGLPGGPVSDFVSGALLLVRRALLGAGGGVVSAAAAEPTAVTVVDPIQHVLLIGVDGTNLSAILADSYNQAFFDLMNGGTTGAATMVGHTTISNPGWTGILTGVWSETAGVSNNVFTPWTYDTWPTVFNQLETSDPTIATTFIGNWEVTAQIAGAGSVPADTIVYYPLINDSWLETDDAVGARSVQAILDTAADRSAFQMTYFVGVDETGHDTGGSGTPQYAEALRNVNDNIAALLAAVDAWEAANPGEEWTVIVVTDHGQVPYAPLGLGLLAHGFQSPAETTVFVIANGADFLGGAVNNTYSQVDITPTILRLFGQSPEPYFQGMALMDRAASDYFPALPGQAALKNALSDAINMYGYPDVMTDLVLTIRTIAATVPYFIYTLVEGITAGLPELLALPIKFLGAIIYQLVNIPVQLIVRATGVTGNQIIPPQLWPYNPVPGTQPVPPAPAVPVEVRVGAVVAA